MSTQLSIEDAIAAGERGMALATEKAEREGFNTEAARAFVLDFLLKNGPSWGEVMVDAARAAGRPELQAADGRAWGSVFSTLVKRHRIRCLRADGIRLHGNGTAGARQWSLIQ